MKIAGINKGYYSNNNNCNCPYNPSMTGLQTAVLKSGTKKSGNKIIQGIKNYFINYREYIDYTWQHKKAFLKVEKDLCGKNTLGGYLHDTDKLIMYAIGVPHNLANKIHMATAPHHIRNGNVKRPMMAIIDWECARYTKPDKQLNARTFYEKKCPKIPVIEMLLDKYGL